MAQNFKRRITLLPDSYHKIQSSFEKFKEIDLSEKTDLDTFNKSTMNKKTPIKDKKFDPSLLETPFIEKKKLRKISIYSPLSFTENSNIKDTPISTDEEIIISKNTKKENLPTKKVTKFNNQISENEEDIPIFNAYFFNFSKRKKLINENNKKATQIIEFHDKDNKSFTFPLFNDKHIFEQDNIIKDNEMKFFNNNDDEMSDEEQIHNDFNICLNQLDEAIYYYSNYPYCISRNINN